MKCSKCGSALVMGEKFCGECGAPRAGLSPQFLSTEGKYAKLKSRLQAGEIPQADFEKALHDLVVRDEKGQLWMIGVESEEWHRYDGTQWQKEDPPAAAKEAPRPSKPKPLSEDAYIHRVPSRPAAATPALNLRKKASAGRWLLPVGGCFLVLVLLCGIFLVFRQPLTNAFVNLALEQGWGKVVTEEATAQEEYAPIAVSPEPIAAQPLEPGWELVPCTPAGVQFGRPPGYSSDEFQDTAQLLFRREDGQAGLDITCGRAANGGTFESELAWWLAFQDGVEWTPAIHEPVAIGAMAWSRGLNTHNNPVFTAVVGPTRNQHIIQFWGLAPEAEWEEATALFLEIVRSARYAP